MACFQYNVYIAAADVAMSDDQRVHFNYFNCSTSSPAAIDFYSSQNTTINNAFCNDNDSGIPTYYILVGGSQTLPPNGSYSYVTLTTCNTPTPTQTPTHTPTPSPTATKAEITCGLGTTTGSYYYTDCCGNFITGTDVGTTVSLNYKKPSNGITKLYQPTSVSCPTPTQTPTLTMTPSSSPTPTVTPTMTKTPTSTSTPNPTPQPTQVFRVANNCDVFTLFPMGVDCVTLSNPSSSNSSDGILSLNITGGTSPYTISWSNGQKTKTNAGLNPGNYTVQVVDFYGDYSSTTVCSLFGPTPTTTQTPTLTPSSSQAPTYPNLCISILSNTTTIQPAQYYYNGIINGKPSWINGTYVMSWSNLNQKWSISNYTLFGGTLQSTSTANVPTSGWILVGGTSSPTISVTTGICPSYAPLNVIVSKNNPTCTNDGSIMVTTTGGLTPYLYSIDGGSNFTTANVFNGLSAGEYAVITKDSIGNTSNSTVTLTNTVAASTTYILSVRNYYTRNINSGYKKAYWVVESNPPIPQGTSVSLVLNVENTQTINSPGSGTTNNLTIVYSGATVLSPSTNNSSNQIITRPNCSPQTSNITNNVQTYNITMGYGDVISGLTNSTLSITSGDTADNGCVTNLTQDVSVYVSTATASGCNCCSVNTDSTASGGIQEHSISFGQGQSTQIYYGFRIGTGTTQTNACSDWDNNITRRINSSVFAEGVTIYGGSPNNPTPILGSSFCVYEGKLWTMYPNTGQVGPIVKSGQNQAGC